MLDNIWLFSFDLLAYIPFPLPRLSQSKRQLTGHLIVRALGMNFKFQPRNVQHTNPGLIHLDLFQH